MAFLVGLLLTTFATHAAPAAPGGRVIVEMSLPNLNDASPRDAYQAYRHLRLANPGDRVLSLSDHRGTSPPGAWRKRVDELRDELARLVAREGRIDLVVVHAGANDFERLLDEVSLADGSSLLAPLRGRLTARAKVILLGPHPLGTAEPAFAAGDLLRYLEIPTGTLVAATSPLRLRATWRQFVKQAPERLAHVTALALGIVAVSRVPAGNEALVMLGAPLAQAGLAYVSHEIRRRLTPTPPVTPDSFAGESYDGLFDGEAIFGLFTVADLTGAAAVVGVTLGLAAVGPGLLDASLLGDTAFLAAYMFGGLAVLPRLADRRVARRERREDLNRGASYRFAEVDDEVPRATPVSLSDLRTYRCEDAL